MRKNFLFQLLTIMMVSIVSICLPSCYLNSDNADSSSDDLSAVLIIDAEHKTNDDASFINADTKTISFISLGEGDNGYFIESLDILHNECQSMTNISYYENGLVKCFGNNNYTIVFSNYDNHKVDVAIMSNDYIQVIKEYEGNINWDEYKSAYSQKLDTRSVGEFVEAISKFLRDKNTQLIIHQAIDILNIAQKGAIKAADKEILQALAKQITDLLVDGLGLIVEESTVLDIISNLQTFSDLKDFLSNSYVLSGNPWGFFLLLLANYPTYEDFCTDMWLKFFEWKDKSYNKNIEHGLGTLNSGYGDLKVTLSWDFYADIDLYAQEPNGTVIFFDNPYSSSGGFLDVDNRDGGRGSTENIYWKQPKDGVYRIGISYYGPSTYNYLSQSGVCKVTIMYRGRGYTYNIPMSPNYDYMWVAEILLSSGEYTLATESAPKVSIMANKIPKSA